MFDDGRVPHRQATVPGLADAVTLSVAIDESGSQPGNYREKKDLGIPSATVFLLDVRRRS